MTGDIYYYEQTKNTVKSITINEKYNTKRKRKQYLPNMKSY